MSEDWLRVFKNVSPRGDMAWMTSAARQIEAIAAKFNINDINSMSHLIGHMAEETAGFTRFEENMNYSAARLHAVWPSRFPTVASALPYAHNPQHLANKVYGGRMGNTGPDDGWIYRGSGPLQHTGKSEFERIKRRTGVDVLTHPDDLRSRVDASTGLLAGASYFVDRHALEPAKRNDVSGSTRAINGGLIGLADRKIWIERARKALLLGDVKFDTKALGLLSAAPSSDPINHGIVDQKTSVEKHLSAQDNTVKAAAATPFLAGGAAVAAAAMAGTPLSLAAAMAAGVFVLGTGTALGFHRRAQSFEPLPRFAQIGDQS